MIPPRTTDTFDRPFATATNAELRELLREYLAVVQDNGAHHVHRHLAADDLACVRAEILRRRGADA